MIYTKNVAKKVAKFIKIIDIIDKIYRTEESRKKKIKKERIASDWIKTRKYCLAKVNSLKDYEFKRIFRVDRKTFSEIVENIRPLLPKDEERAKRNLKGSNGSIINVETMLMATLRFLAGGSHYDICLAFDIGFGSFFGERGVIWPTLRAIDEYYTIGLSLNEEDLKKQAEEFAALTESGRDEMYGCVMAIDGWVCMTRKPTMAEVDRPMDYYNRKGFWGFTVLAGCDARTKFHMFSCKSAGSCNDISVWQVCDVYKKILQAGLLPAEYYFIGDEAFSCEQQILTPWGGKGIGHEKDSFNYQLSARRQVIERSFAILTGRWGIFQRPLRCAVDKWSLVATVAAKLHNICVDKNIPLISSHECNTDDADVWEVITNAQANDASLVTTATATTGARRKVITEKLANFGIRRPMYAIHNSKAN